MKIKWNIGRRHLCFFLLFFQLCFSLFNSFFSFFQLCFYLFNCWQLLSPEGGSVANGGGGRVSWVAAGLCRSAPGRPGRPPPWHDLLPLLHPWVASVVEFDPRRPLLSNSRQMTPTRFPFVFFLSACYDAGEVTQLSILGAGCWPEVIGLVRVLRTKPTLGNVEVQRCALLPTWKVHQQTLERVQALSEESSLIRSGAKFSLLTSSINWHAINF